MVSWRLKNHRNCDRAVEYCDGNPIGIGSSGLCVRDSYRGRPHNSDWGNFHYYCGKIIDSMGMSTSAPAYPESVSGIKLLREEGAWKYIDLEDGLAEESLIALLREMPKDRELCFFEYQFGDLMSDTSGLYVMLQVFEGVCYFWKGNHGRTSALESMSFSEAAALIQKNTSQEDAFLYLVPVAGRFETRPDFRWHKAPERSPDSQGELVRHTLSSLAFRFQRVVRHQTNEFGDFAAGQAARTPLEIVHHMRGVMTFTASELSGQPRAKIEQLPWLDEIAAFNALLVRLDEIFLANSFNEILFKKLIQGPISDAITHVGQLAMLRRLYGNPVPGMNFFEAEIATGK
jgi:hypothetical protein